MSDALMDNNHDDCLSNCSRTAPTKFSHLLIEFRVCNSDSNVSD